MTPTPKKNVLQKFQSPTALLGSLKCKLVIDQETRPLILFLAEKKAMVRRVSAEGFEVFHQKMSTIRKKNESNGLHEGHCYNNSPPLVN
jgi:hypothetical protein